MNAPDILFLLATIAAGAGAVLGRLTPVGLCSAGVALVSLAFLVR